MITSETLKTLIELLEFHKSIYSSDQKDKYKSIKTTIDEYSRVARLIVMIATLKSIGSKIHLAYLFQDLSNYLTYLHLDLINFKFTLKKKKKKKYKIIEITWALFCLSRLIELTPQLIKFIGSESLEEYNKKVMNGTEVDIIAINLADILNIATHVSCNVIHIMEFLMIYQLLYTSQKKRAFLLKKKKKPFLSKIKKKKLLSLIEKNSLNF